MQIFAWLTDVNRHYGPGTVAVAAPDVETARSLILADFDRWIRSEDEEGPYISGCFDASTEDGFASWMEDWEKEESNEEIEKHYKQLREDLDRDPKVLPGGVLYISGSE